MNYLKATTCCMLACMSLFLATRISAQTYDMNSREWSSLKSGSTLKTCFTTTSPSTPCDTLVCQVDFFNSPSVLGSSFSIKDIRSYVKFYVDHTDPDVYK